MSENRRRQQPQPQTRAAAAQREIERLREELDSLPLFASRSRRKNLQEALDWAEAEQMDELHRRTERRRGMTFGKPMPSLTPERDQHHRELQELYRKFPAWLSWEMSKETHRKRQELAQHLGVEPNLIDSWKDGSDLPAHELIPAIVDFFRSGVHNQGADTHEYDATRDTAHYWKTGAAVLVGVSRYTDSTLPDIRSIENNLNSMKRIVTKGFGVLSPNVYKLVNPTSAEQVHEAIGEAIYSTDPKSGNLFIYYAGHGWTADDGSLLLSLVGSNPKKPWSAISFNAVRSQLTTTNISRRVLILDSCFSGAALDTLSPGMGASARIEGTYVMTSSGPTTESKAPPDAQYTTFTGEVIRALENGIPGGPSTINTDTLFNHVQRSLEGRGPKPGRQVAGDGHRVALMMNQWGK
ncbi:caspase family protein [Streptomyces sp. NEAU-YJ-81]|uniref:caspase, EACC1-associated type n=1 Tax=Streptomyces sp. NEAU-YJ-81 TaxID=2820288 RepID=UPI001ABC7D22|nr:caspase family protein [Streptomyces sp. NEAU-YJ-81]MBO3682256.1 caspase family protein [Streptomyces sp. NEAU-YJ-81]